MLSFIQFQRTSLALSELPHQHSPTGKAQRFPSSWPRLQQRQLCDANRLSPGPEQIIHRFASAHCFSSTSNKVSRSTNGLTPGKQANLVVHRSSVRRVVCLVFASQLQEIADRLGIGEHGSHDTAQVDPRLRVFLLQGFALALVFRWGAGGLSENQSSPHPGDNASDSQKTGTSRYSVADQNRRAV